MARYNAGTSAFRREDSVSILASKWQRPEILEAVFDQLSDALFLYDKDLTIVGVNRAAQLLFGTSSEEMIGKQCRELFRCTTCEPNCGVLQGMGPSSCMPTGTISLHTANGRERLVVIRTVQLLDDAGAVEGVVATVKDITEEAEPAKRQIVAESQAMREMMEFVRRVAVSEASSILIEGENGTGKDLIAKTLHYQSLRQAEPFLAINCAAIPETRDGGATWESSVVLPGEDPREGSIYFTDENHGALLTGGKFFYSADGGKTWTGATGQIGGKPRIEFAGAKVGWAIRYQSMTYTVDGGQH